MYFTHKIDTEDINNVSNIINYAWFHSSIWSNELDIRENVLPQKHWNKSKMYLGKIDKM